MNSIELINDYLLSNDINGDLKEGDVLSEGIPYVMIGKPLEGSTGDWGGSRIDIEVVDTIINVWYMRTMSDSSWEGPVKINLFEPNSLNNLIRIIKYLDKSPPKVSNDSCWRALACEDAWERIQLARKRSACVAAAP